nr:hypothetical protein [Conexibacter sp. S30A1]
MRLAAHPQPLGEPQRRTVASVDPRDDPVQTELLETQPHQLSGRLGRVSMAGVRGIEDPANLRAAMKLAPLKQSDVTNKPCAIGELDAQDHARVFGRERGLCPATLELLHDHRAAHGLKRHESANLLKRPIRQQRIGVADRQRTQQKSGCAERIGRSELH